MASPLHRRSFFKSSGTGLAGVAVLGWPAWRYWVASPRAHYLPARLAPRVPCRLTPHH